MRLGERWGAGGGLQGRQGPLLPLFSHTRSEREAEWEGEGILIWVQMCLICLRGGRTWSSVALYHLISRCYCCKYPVYWNISPKTRTTDPCRKPSSSSGWIWLFISCPALLVWAAGPSYHGTFTLTRHVKPLWASCSIFHPLSIIVSCHANGHNCSPRKLWKKVSCPPPGCCIIWWFMSSKPSLLT